MPSCSGSGWPEIITEYVINNKHQPRTFKIVCIELYSTPETFHNARDKCRSNGGYLVGLDTTHIQYGTSLREKLNNEKMKSLNHKGFWLNLIKSASNPTKVYTDTSQPIEIGLLENITTNIDISEFDLHTKCPHISDAWKFLNSETDKISVSASDCNLKKPFLCEREAPATADLILNTTLCPSGWFHSITENQCFKFFSHKANFTEAQKTCDKHQAQLPCPQNTIQNMVVSNMTQISLQSVGCNINSPCKNGGVCLFNENGFEKCQCPIDFTGDYCEKISSSAMLKNHTICSPGKYLLPFCLMVCKCKNDRLCDIVTGECPGLVCEKGWYGRQCNIYAPLPNTWLDIQNHIAEPTCSNQRTVNKDFYASATENIFPGSCTITNEFMYEGNKFWKSENCEEKRNFVCITRTTKG